jgi:hypothetical protein
MNFHTSCLAATLLCPIALYGNTTFNLGIASPFAVFSGSAVTSTGATNVYGNVGVWPGTDIGGFPPATLSGGTIHAGDAFAMQAFGALNTAFGAAHSTPCGTNLSGQNLGGLTLTAGVYCFSSSAFLGGQLTLDAQGDANAVFIFQTTNGLTTGMGSSVVLANGAQGSGILWEIGTSANLGESTSFAGNILAQGNVTLNPNATIQCGSATSLNGVVTLDTNDISICGSLGTDPVTDPALTPEPSTASLFLLSGLPVLWLLRRCKPVHIQA